MDFDWIFTRYFNYFKKKIFLFLFSNDLKTQII